MPLAKPLIDRVVVCKYLLKQARLVLASSVPFSAGIAVGQLQDATELFLRVVAEHCHASVKEQSAFQQLITAVESALQSKLSHRTALNQLNKARVNFKHFGLEPTRADADKLLRDVEAFLPAAADRYLGIDFASVSLASVLGHQRTRNWLRRAEESLDAGDFIQAISASAIGFAVFRYHLGSTIERTRLDRFGRISRYRRVGYGESGNAGLADLVESVEEELDDIRSQIDLMLTGVDLSQYRTFLRFAPRVSINRAGIVHVYETHHRAVEPSREHAEICLSFVIDAAIGLKRTHVPNRFTRQSPEVVKEVEVRAAGEIIVYPSDSAEVIRTVEAGEILLEVKARSLKGFVPVLQDREVAYFPEANLDPGTWDDAG